MAGKARHGWRGDPPRSETEARKRIVGAAMRCVDRYGPAKTGLSDVAHERLPGERYLGVLLTSGRSGRFFAGVTSPEAIEFARSLLERTAVDWEKAGYGHAELDELAEFALRLLLSLVLDPGTPARSGSVLRGFLRRWAGPAIACGAAGRP